MTLERKLHPITSPLRLLFEFWHHLTAGAKMAAKWSKLNGFSLFKNRSQVKALCFKNKNLFRAYSCTFCIILTLNENWVPRHCLPPTFNHCWCNYWRNSIWAGSNAMGNGQIFSFSVAPISRQSRCNHKVPFLLFFPFSLPFGARKSTHPRSYKVLRHPPK